MSQNREKAPQISSDQPFLLRLADKLANHDQLAQAEITLSQISFFHPERKTFSCGWSFDTLRLLAENYCRLTFSIHTLPFDKRDRHYYRTGSEGTLQLAGRLVTEMSQSFRGDSITAVGHTPLILDTDSSTALSLRSGDFVLLSIIDEADRDSRGELFDQRLKELINSDEIRRHADGTLFVSEHEAHRVSHLIAGNWLAEAQ